MKKLNEFWVEFNGIKSSDIGALMVKMPTRNHPVIQYDQVDIKGRDGKLFVTNGNYGTITTKVDLVVPKNADLPRVLNWLKGRGNLRFSDSPDYYYDAYVATSFARSSPVQRLEGQKMTVTFTCQPFRMAVNEQTINQSTKTFYGQGDMESMPLVAVTGSGNVDLMINSETILLSGITSSHTIYLDCDAGLAYTINGGSKEFAGQYVTVVNDWFRLKPSGQWNEIGWSGTINQLIIKPRWRWF